jgi:hypothetical protein
MNTFNLKKLNLSSKILCSFLGHEIVTTRKVTDHFKEYKCSICGIEMTNDIQGHKISLTPELKDLNKILNRLYIKKQYSI